MKSNILKIILVSVAMLIVANLCRAQTTRPVEQRIISLMAIGGEWGDQSNRYMPAEIVKEGWGVYLKRYLAPQIKAGVTRAALWCYLGRDERLNMDFDGFEKAQALGARSKVHHGLPTALRRYTGPDFQVICYTGQPPSDAAFAARELHARQPNVGRYFRFADVQTQQVRDGGAVLGLDVTSGIKVDSMAWAWITYRRLCGETIIGEGWPTKDASHLHDLPFFVTEGNLDQAIRGGFLAASKSVLTGEIIVILQQPDAGEGYDSDWELRKARKYLAQGFSVCVPMYRQIVEKKRTLAEFGG